MKLASFGLLLFCFLLTSCGVPNLESKECSEAREAVKRFYSFHFANEMSPSVDYLKAREKFLAPRWFEHLLSLETSGGLPSNTVDYFTLSDKHFPRTFKIGACTSKSATDVEFQVQVYWRDDEKTEQKEVRAYIVNDNGSWLLANVKDKAN